MKFTIDKSLVLDTDNNIISHYHSNEKSLLINAISTRLFMEILINPSGVSRNHLLEKVWSEHGLIPSSSNLNNHMSILRKAIFSVTENEDYIITLPKKGFIFNKKYKIEKINTTVDEDDISLKKTITRFIKKPRIMMSLPYATILLFAGFFTLSSDGASALIGSDVFLEYKQCTLKSMTKVSAHRKNNAIRLVEDAMKLNSIDCNADSYDVYFYLKGKDKKESYNFNFFSFCKKEGDGDYAPCNNVKSV